MSTYNPAGGQTYTLSGSISSTATSITLSSFTEPVTGTVYTMANLNTDIAYGTIAPKTTSSEFISFTGITANADGTATLTGVTRGLAKKYPFTSDAAYKLPHSGQSQFILSDAPQVFQQYVPLTNDVTVSGVKTFSSTPVSSAGLPTNSDQLATKQYVDNTATGTTTINRIVVAATAGETIAVDQLVYLKASDGRWWLADADSAASSENVILGIAQGAGTAGNAITNGVLTQGFNTFTGLTLTANTKYYASNTAGGFSSTPGTQEVTLGESQTTTTFLFFPRNDQQITENEQDALVGTSGTPSATNKYVTNDDTATAATADKVARRLSTGGVTVPSSPTNSTDSASKAYADFSRTIPLGESFTGATTPQPAVIVDDLELRYTDQTCAVGYSTYGSNTNVREIAIKIVPQSNVTIGNARIFAQKNGTPANVTMEVQTDSASLPSGTPVTNGTSNAIVAATFSGSMSHMTFTFTTPFSLTAGTTYWAVIKLASLSDANNITVQTLTNANKYAAFAGAQKDGSNVWQSGSEMPYVKLIPSSGSGSLSLWRADGNGVEPLPIFDGFCATTGSAGASGTIQRNITSGFSGLIPYADYYLSNTIGTITVNANEGMYVGYAISATQIATPFKSTLPRFTRVALVNSINLIHPTIEDGTLLLVASSSGVGANIPIYAMQTYADATNPTGSTLVASFTNGTGSGTITHTMTVPLNKASYYQSINTAGTLYWIGSR